MAQLILEVLLNIIVFLVSTDFKAVYALEVSLVPCMSFLIWATSHTMEPTHNFTEFCCKKNQYKKNQDLTLNLIQNSLHRVDMPCIDYVTYVPTT